jgi:hypothetical protein
MQIRSYATRAAISEDRTAVVIALDGDEVEHLRTLISMGMGSLHLDGRKQETVAFGDELETAFEDRRLHLAEGHEHVVNSTTFGPSHDTCEEH